MKGCLVLQRRFAYVGHELAVLLKESHTVKEFCAFASERDSYDFLKTQKEVAYTDILLDQDVQKRFREEALDMDFIRGFEREYGSVWSFLSVDRVIRYGQLVREYPFDTPPYSYEEMLRMVQVYAKSITDFLQKEKPDFVLTYQPGALWMLLMYAIAKKRGIPVLTIILPVTRDRVVLSEEYERLTWVDKRFAAELKEPPARVPHYAEATAFVSEFRARPVAYSSVYLSLVKHGKWRQFDFLMPRYASRTLSNALRIVREWRRNREKRSDYTTIRPVDHFFDRTIRKMRNLIGVDDLYDAFDTTVPFAFYPLHYEPELSVLLHAPFDIDQTAIIWRVARSLPAGMYLYVKEHPQMTTYRTRAYYKKLKKIPNVRLMRPEISSFELIRSSELVTVISGAVGWEAAMLGKPVITFGDVFYNSLPSVAHSDTPKGLPALILHALSHPVSREEAERYLAALFADSAQCDLLHVWEFETDRKKKREALGGFAALIATKIREVASKTAKS